MNTATDAEYLNVKSLAAKLGVSTWSVYRNLNEEDPAKQWPSAGVGRSIRFSPEDVAAIEALIHSKPSRSKPAPAGLTAQQKSAAIKRLGLRNAA
jgi:predicted DNA-binding transcriptional regulator AlpA